MIEVKNLTKIYGGGVKAVDNISFRIEPGKIYGFLGPNGAGKSTTMNIMTGYLAATSGTVTINGYDIYRDAKKAKSCIGYLPEQPPLYMELTPKEYLEICAGLKKVPKDKRAMEVAGVIKRTGLTKVQDRLIRSLSKGYKQRVGLAQALLGSPEIIILDEPTVGLDPIQIIEIRDLIKSLKKDHTVILSSHILTEVDEICDSIIIINKGKLVAEDTTKNLGSSDGKELLVLTVRGKKEAVRSVILKTVGEKVGLAFSNSSESDCIDVRIEYTAGRDIREDLSYAFAVERIPVLGMRKETVSLEEVFIEYTANDKSGEKPADIYEYEKAENPVLNGGDGEGKQ
ncbi:MAG: ABC transporter ATP-binding protein [Ruminococcaceae bacterium]|nr:ABC transporter ATP-binding protein [Oscillospiraceae bacterium]